MLPSLSLSLSSSSASSAAVMVDKATSDFLMAPDWTMNMEICDSANSDHGMAKEVIKAVKKRLQNKNPRVEMLTLTLLETLVKNCGDHIHFYIAERKVLDEMIKIVKKRTDVQVRAKILVLVDSWQQAFGGSGGKHAQYYWAYDELRRSGVQFPQRSLDTVPIITPPATQPSTGNPQSRLGLPSSSSPRLDEAMAPDAEGLSASGMETIRNAMEFLDEMLQAVSPNDRMSVKDEVIVDLVDRCRTNQRRLVQMLGTTMDEELLGQGLELNDALQGLLAKHDAIASGSQLPAQLTTSTPRSRPNESSVSTIKPSGSRPEDSSSSTNNAKPSGDAMKGRAVEEEEVEEDEFALLAKRHSRGSPIPVKSEDAASSSGPTFCASTVPESSFSNALVAVDPPLPVKSTKDQDMVDFLSIVLSTSLTSEEEVEVGEEEKAETRDPAPPNNSYVVPWAQSQPPQIQNEAQFSPQQSQHLSSYPPPPWAPTPGYATMPPPMPKNVSTPYANSGIPTLPQSANHQLGISPTLNSTSPHKPYVPSYKLFEDLNVFGSVQGKARSGPYSTASASSTHSVVGGRR